MPDLENPVPWANWDELLFDSRYDNDCIFLFPDCCHGISAFPRTKYGQLARKTVVSILFKIGLHWFRKSTITTKAQFPKSTFWKYVYILGMDVGILIRMHIFNSVRVTWKRQGWCCGFSFWCVGSCCPLIARLLGRFGKWGQLVNMYKTICVYQHWAKSAIPSLMQCWFWGWNL